MIHDVLEHDHMQWTVSIDKIFHQLVNLLPNWTLIPNLTFYLIVRGVYYMQRIYGMPKEDALSSEHLTLSHFGT